MKRQLPRSIVLIGMMGAGKSAVGECLQRRTGLIPLDTDEIVAAKLAISIPEIFSKYGEERFREAESEALRSISAAQQAIVITGGGIVLREENVDPLKRLGTIVWLDADDETLFEQASRNEDRPLLQTENPRAAFSKILSARRPLYAKVADVRVETSMLTDEEVAEAVLELLEANAK